MYYTCIIPVLFSVDFLVSVSLAEDVSVAELPFDSLSSEANWETKDPRWPVIKGLD